MLSWVDCTGRSPRKHEHSYSLVVSNLASLFSNPKSLKTGDTAILDGQRIYYNHIRPHQGLNGKTPAQAAGLELDLGVNKWQSLIEKSAKTR